MIAGAAPACGGCQVCPAVVRVAAGPRCAACQPREYGQHDARSVPAMVNVTLGAYPRSPNHRKFGPFREFTVPVPEAIRAQIATRNAVAHEAGRVLEVYPTEAGS